MSRPPRDLRSPLFSLPLVTWSLIQRTTVFAASAALFWLALRNGMPESEVRSLAFVALVVGNVVLILTGRSFSTSILRAFSRPNRTLWIVLGIDAMLLAIILGFENVRALFRFGPLHADDLLLCLGIGFAVLVVLENVKRLFGPALRRWRALSPIPELRIQ